MKKALLLTLVVLFAVVAIGIAYLASLDGDISVSRQIEINTTPEEISGNVANFNTWPHWSPWFCLDESIKVNVSGQGKLLGDKLSWQGSLIGSGEIEHTELLLPNVIKQTIYFKEPFKSQSEVLFTFTPSAQSTVVQWEMKGEMPFLFRFMAKKMKPLIEMDYDRGLKMLKEYAENGTVASVVKIKGIEQFKGIEYVGKSEICDREELTDKVRKTIEEVSNWLVINNTFPEESVVIYKQNSPNSKTCDYTGGFRINSPFETSKINSAITDSITSGKVLRVTFNGDYHHLANAWTAAELYIRHHQLQKDEMRNVFEVYMNDPAFFPNPADWVTELYFPIK